MKERNRMGKVIVVILMLIAIQTIQAIGQKKENIRVYDSPEEMVVAAKEIITEIPVNEFRDIYTNENLFIIDVRTAEEYNAGAVPGAINIPRGVLEFRIGKKETWESAGVNPPDKDDPIIVYCGTGSRGALSAKALLQLGYTNVKSVEGGWGAWQKNRKQE